MKSWDEVEATIEARDQHAAQLVAAEQQRQQQKQQAERLRDKLFEIMWVDINASPTERQYITNLVRHNKPEQLNNPDVYRIMLLEVRALNLGR